MAASVLFLASRAFPSWVGTTWQLDYKKGARFEQDEYRHKIRNPNLEIRNKSEAKNPKEPRLAFRVLGFEHSGLFRIRYSDFGFGGDRPARAVSLLLQCRRRFPQH